MADFDAAYDPLLVYEGGWVNDPVDIGGETYRGISRRFHPGWSGWANIDRLRRRKNFPGNLDEDGELQREVRVFYRREYWNRFSGDDIPDQSVAEEMFELSVNLGVRRAVRFLQRALNLLNRNERDYPDIVEDGESGPITLRTLKTNLRRDRTPMYVLRLLNLQQGEHYVDFMRRDPTQERFARGWLKRT